jgi:hypothetical protein
MPVAMTFNSLQADLRRYLERGYVADTEVYEQLPALINLAERGIATELKILGTLNVLTDTMAIGTSVYSKPDRWRATASINFGVGVGPLQERVNLFPRSYEYCRTYWPNSALQEQPEFYADYDYDHWLIVPTPDFAYPFEVNIWEQPPLLDNANQTNWLTDFAPQALLYGSLVQCFPFLKDGVWTAAWSATYKEQLALLNAQDLQRVIDRTVTRRTV